MDIAITDNVEKNYQAVLELREITEIVDYLKENMDTPVGKEYFVPRDYQWAKTAFTISLTRYHQKVILQRLKSGESRDTVKELDRKFKEGLRLFEDYYVMASDIPARIWAESHYLIPYSSYLLPTRYEYSFAYKVWRGWEFYKRVNEQPLNGPLYQWKKIGSNPRNGRARLILVHSKTGIEAPLLSDIAK